MLWLELLVSQPFLRIMALAGDQPVQEAAIAFAGRARLAVLAGPAAVGADDKVAALHGAGQGHIDQSQVFGGAAETDLARDYCILSFFDGISLAHVDHRQIFLVIFAAFRAGC